MRQARKTVRSIRLDASPAGALQDSHDCSPALQGSLTDWPAVMSMSKRVFQQAKLCECRWLSSINDLQVGALHGYSTLPGSAKVCTHPFYYRDNKRVSTTNKSRSNGKIIRALSWSKTMQPSKTVSHSAGSAPSPRRPSSSSSGCTLLRAACSVSKACMPKLIWNHWCIRQRAKSSTALGIIAPWVKYIKKHPSIERKKMRCRRL